MSLISAYSRIRNGAKRQYQNAKPSELHVIEVLSGHAGRAAAPDGPAGAVPDAADAAGRAGENGSDRTTAPDAAVAPTGLDDANWLIHGDNLGVMTALRDTYGLAGKLQMIYIDPPFFSKSDYDAVVKVGGEEIRPPAYGDTWKRGMPDYLKMLTARLYLMRDLLADDGLIWVHLDWHAVHAVKLLLDEIFGEANFVNEIIWTYKSGGTGKRHFARKHDTILVYGKTRRYQFFPLQEKSYNRQLKPYHFQGVREYRDEVGWYTMVNMKDVWQIDMVGRTSAERTGYATQKPEALLERMVACCTREGDLCADFFCGSGTLPAVATAMGRRCIACDSGNLAITHTASRLSHAGVPLQIFAATPGGRRRRTTPSPLSVQVELTAGEVPGADKVLLHVTLASVQVRDPERYADPKSQAAVRRILASDPLQLVAAWSVDFDRHAPVHRPEQIFLRAKGRLPLTCEKLTDQSDLEICVRVADVFGNVACETVRYSR